ncbi:uncharacterized protein DEA37_0005358 [Paragonimus westermani]|uniref:Transmembrane protein 115 n=1 Tax=Paragonimus westermani TaxID=34504 RepID=A0A5J4NKM6_9TREM|nr:uncharacterized protein DEA37_0005358 [Paragonimus westermani]
MKPSALCHVSNWTAGSCICLTLSYLICLLHRPWFHTFAFYPTDAHSAWHTAPFLTFWIVTDEHVTHWLTILALLILDKLIRDSWSKRETMVFILFDSICSVLCSSFMLVIFGASPSTAISGNAALISAVTVVSTQFDSERFLVGYGSSGLKSRYGFFTGFLLYFFLALVSFVSWGSFLLYSNGFVFAWIYIRFLQHHSQRKYGDHRACFAFSKFFPGPLERWVALPSNLIYMVLLRTKLCPGIERHSEIVSTASFAVGLPGLTSDEDRHRRLALKALNERLFNKPQPEEGIEWPSLEEQDEKTATNATKVEVQSLIVDLTAIASSSESSPTDLHSKNPSHLT